MQALPRLSRKRRVSREEGPRFTRSPAAQSVSRDGLKSTSCSRHCNGLRQPWISPTAYTVMGTSVERVGSGQTEDRNRCAEFLTVGAAHAVAAAHATHRRLQQAAAGVGRSEERRVGKGGGA